MHFNFFKLERFDYMITIIYNSFILNNIIHESQIHFNKKDGISDIDYEIWGSICDTNIFPQLSQTDNLNHRFYSICYRTDSTGGEPLTD